MSDTPYREPAPGRRRDDRPPPPDPYVAAWRQLRRRRLGALSLVLPFLPVTIVAYEHLGRGGLVVGVLLFIPTIVMMGRLYLFVCPRCQNLFFVGAGFRPPLLPDLFYLWHCEHCHIETGTPKYQAEPR